MRRISLAFVGFIVACSLSTPAPAQIKLPKIPKIKVDGQPKPAAEPAAGSSDADGPAAQQTTASPSSGGSKSGGPYAVKPTAPDVPQFLPDTLHVDIERWDYHWKVPNDNHNSSWAPRIRFNVWYGGSARQRYKAEYFMPDGSPWYSEALEFQSGFNSSNSLAKVQSANDSNKDKKALVTGGNFGIKITDMRDNSVVYQGKFNVARYKPKYSDARYKNEVDYYVDYDWRLPIGYADIYWEQAVADPTIRMWFKGDLKVDGFEARLFKDGQQIATTDDAMGGVSSNERIYAFKRGDDESLSWTEFSFSWPKRAEFIVSEELRGFTAHKGSKFINQMPGEYTVKIFYNGEQVRETKFAIGTEGTYADNGIAKRNGLTTNKVILPVKVMGTLDKWNPAKAKGHYGNPMEGIQ